MEDFLDFVHIAMIIAFLGLVGYILYDGYTKMMENKRAYEECKLIDAFPIWTKDNVMVCVAARRSDN